MSAHPPQPLSTEERELAQRLARVDPPGEPSPALDARILAAAHAAVARRPSPSSRARRRWPVAFGVAASLALAVGIAWQLRPLPQAPPAYDEAASVMVQPPASGRVQQDAASDSVAEQLAVTPPTPKQSAAARALPPPAEAEMQAGAALERDAAAAASVDEAPIVFDPPRPSDVPAAPSPMPAPPPPPAAMSAAPQFNPAPAPPAPIAPVSTMEQRARKESAAGAANSQQRSLSIEAAKARDSEANDAATLDSITTGQGSEEGFDQRPPSTADSPTVRQAWLQRIRELIADGETDAARDSLEEFKRRHPGVALPDDLRRFDQPH